MENTKDREIINTRIIDAPRERVWKAWTDQKEIDIWWGPNGFTNKTISMDVRPGGLWRYIMHGPNKDWDNRVEYLKVEKPSRLVFYLGSDKDHDPQRFHVTVTFEEQNGKTKLTQHTVLNTAAQLEEVKKFGAVEGGRQTLDRLEAHVSGGTMKKYDINIVRTFNAPRDLVWKAWTTPELIKQWWGPKGFDSPEVKIDFRPGGSYLYAMRGLEGEWKGTTNWSGGKIVEIDKPNRIVLTDYFADEHGNQVDPTVYGMDPNFPKESRVVVTFEEIGDKTKLTIHYAPETQAAHDAMLKTGMNEGWNSSLDKLQAVVEEE